MEYLISRIVDFIISLDPFVRSMLIGLFVIFGCLCFIKVIKVNYNPKKAKIQITPIIFAIIFLLIAGFIANV